MKIGRKIYYELATGNIIQDTGEREGSVVETTQAEDFASYNALSQRVPSTVGCIQLNFGELAQDFMSGNSYHIDIATNTIVFDTTPALPVLDVVKQRKIEELKTIEDNALLTFKSSALGTEHTYLSSSNDMILLTGQYVYMKSDDYLGDLPLWYTVEQGNVQHTLAQFVRVYLDCRTNVQTVKYHRAVLEAQVNACTTQLEVDAIVW